MSPSKSCPHDLGGLRLTGTKIKDAGGVIIGVADVHVTCTKRKNTPYLHGKKKGKLQPFSRNITIKTALPAAKALFEIYGASLFSDETDEETEGERRGKTRKIRFRSGQRRGTRLHCTAAQ